MSEVVTIRPDFDVLRSRSEVSENAAVRVLALPVLLFVMGLIYIATGAWLAANGSLLGGLGMWALGIVLCWVPRLAKR